MSFLKRFLNGEGPGLWAFFELMEADEKGRAPDPKAVHEIAIAAEELLGPGKVQVKLEAFGKRLGMFGRIGKGRKPATTAGDMKARLGAVGFMVQREDQLKANGMGKRAATAQAISEAMNRYFLSRRRAQDWRKKYSKLARAEIEELRRNPPFWMLPQPKKIQRKKKMS